MARPRKLTAGLKTEICKRVADGETLREICRDEHMPSRSVVHRELIDDHEFQDQYAFAKELQVEGMADEILEIADDASNDWMEKFNQDGESIGWTINGDHVRRSVLRVDARKWLLAKLAPKKYGDKVEQTVQGPDGGPVQQDLTYRYIVVDPQA